MLWGLYGKPSLISLTFDLHVGPITMYLQLLMEVVPPEKTEWEGSELPPDYLLPLTLKYVFSGPGYSGLNIWCPEIWAKYQSSIK